MVVETMPYIFAATGEWMDHTAHFVFVPPDFVMVYTVDISRRLQAEAELRRQNAYVTSLHETSLGVLQRRELTTLLETILDNAAALVRAPDGFLIWFAGGRELRQIGVETYLDDFGMATPRSPPCTVCRSRA